MAPGAGFAFPGYGLNHLRPLTRQTVAGLTTSVPYPGGNGRNGIGRICFCFRSSSISGRLHKTQAKPRSGFGLYQLLGLALLTQQLLLLSVKLLLRECSGVQ